MIWPKQSAPFGNGFLQAFGWVPPIHQPSTALARLRLQAFSQLGNSCSLSCGLGLLRFCQWQLHLSTNLAKLASPLWILDVFPRKMVNLAKPMRWNKYHIIIYSLTWICWANFRSQSQASFWCSASTHVDSFIVPGRACHSAPQPAEDGGSGPKVDI
jgi:hypothetical protein